MPKEIHAIEPAIPWKGIIGMRNILVHQYFSVDPDIIWDIDGGYANSVYGGVDVSALDGGASNSWS